MCAILPVFLNLCNHFFVRRRNTSSLATQIVDSKEWSVRQYAVPFSSGLALFACLIIRTFQLVFSAGTVFFSHDKSGGTVFQLVCSAKRTGPCRHNTKIIFCPRNLKHWLVDGSTSTELWSRAGNKDDPTHISFCCKSHSTTWKFSNVKLLT